MRDGQTHLLKLLAHDGDLMHFSSLNSHPPFHHPHTTCTDSGDFRSITMIWLTRSMMRLACATPMLITASFQVSYLSDWATWSIHLHGYWCMCRHQCMNPDHVRATSLSMRMLMWNVSTQCKHAGPGVWQIAQSVISTSSPELKASQEEELTLDTRDFWPPSLEAYMSWFSLALFKKMLI